MHVEVPSERSPKPCEVQRGVRTHTAHVSVAGGRGGQCVAVPLTHELAAVCPFSAQEFRRLAEAPASGRLSPQAGSCVLPPVGTSCSDSPGGQAPRLAAPPYLPLPRPQQQQLATVARPGTRWRGQRAGGRNSRGTALSSPAVSAHPKAGWTMNTVKRNWRKKQPDVFRQTVAGDASRAPRSCRPGPALREPRRLAFWLFQQRRGQRGSLRKPRHPPSLRLLYLPLHRTRLFSFLSLKSCRERLALTLTAASLPRTPLPFFSVPDVTRKGTDPGTGGTATLCRGTLFCLETCAAAFHLTNKISLCVSLSAGSNLSPPRSS